MATALITGITGQAGSFLAELLLSKGYNVCGMVRRSSTINTERVSHILDRIQLIPGDLTDQASLIDVLVKSQPDEVYNLAAQSLVPVSFTEPIHTCEVTGMGVIKMLAAIKTVNPKIKFLQISSSEMYGLVEEGTMLHETSPFHPRSPYAVAKAMAHHAAINYRESYGMFAACAICFNFESTKRGHQFVTRKITDGISKIKKGIAKDLKLGNIDAKRDWCFAGDTVRAMYMIMQHTEPDDFVVATGETHSVREFLDESFGYVGMNWHDYVKIDPSLFRPAEVPFLLGDSTKLREKLGWKPGVTFKQLVEMMVKEEIA
jgi:GDPmannose 4,6-dehydratase